MVIFSLSYSQEREIQRVLEICSRSGRYTWQNLDSNLCLTQVTLTMVQVESFGPGALCSTVARLGYREVLGVPCGICTGALGQLSSLSLPHPHCWPGLLTGRGEELGHSLGHKEEGRNKSALVSVFGASAPNLFKYRQIKRKELLVVVEWVPSAVPAPVGSPVSPTKEWIPKAHSRCFPLHRSKFPFCMFL